VDGHGVSGRRLSHRRRGRPRSRGGGSDLEPREEILRHAAALFSRKGVGATRLADIAASVGVSPPAIYYYFDNHRAIVEALLDYVVNESAAFAVAAASADGPCGDRLASLVGQHIERLTSGPYDVWFVAGLSDEEMTQFPGVARRAHEWRRAVATLVREGVERGEFDAVAPELAVDLLSGHVYGALQHRHREGSVDAQAAAQLAVRSLVPAGVPSTAGSRRARGRD
jgi:TetR/AcrR family transcriptional regulator